MIDWILRIIKSNFALPVWVIVWIYLFLVPANFSGLFLMQYETGKWVAVLGAGAIFINIVILLINGGFSKVLAISHLVMWIPLEFILLHRFFTVPDLSSFEQAYILIVAAINGISIGFDFYDTWEWYKGNRGLAGFPDKPAKF